MVDTSERWSFSKQFTITKKRIWKLVNYAWIILIVAFTIMGILWAKDLLFPHKPDNINQPNITVGQGGTAHYTVNQISEKKRSWWQPQPYVAIYGGVRSKSKNDGVDFSSYDPEVGGQIGLRWDL